MDHLDELENQSIYIIREAYAQFKDIALLWSIGKDSTTLLWLVRKAFYDQVPLSVMHIDTSYKFKEIYRFRDRYAHEWGLRLIVVRNEKAIADGMGPKDKLECCNALKTQALKDAIARTGFKAVLLGIRRHRFQVGLPQPAARALGPIQRQARDERACEGASLAGLDGA